MQKNPGRPTLLYVDEFRALLSVSQRKVTENVLPRLNTLWDCPRKDEITKVDTIEVIEPYLVLLSATPLRYAEERLSETHFAGGVLGRFLILAGSRRQAIPLPPPLSPSVLQPLADQLGGLLKAVAPDPVQMFLDHEADLTYQEWFRKFDRRLDVGGEIEEQLLARLPQHVLKLAMAYSTLLGHSAISRSTLTPALAIAEYVEKITHLIFSEVGLTHQDRVEKLVLRCIRDGRGTIKAMKNHLGGRHSVEEINRAISALEQAAIVTSEWRETKKGRKFAWYSVGEEEIVVIPPEKSPT
ncbi:MAG: DUF3987 domain-containing protein [candidate division NC10 bacterium]|nr:DUF3987 domain-containing protein [candidate division NC10 bacterium]